MNIVKKSLVIPAVGLFSAIALSPVAHQSNSHADYGTFNSNVSIKDTKNIDVNSNQITLPNSHQKIDANKQDELIQKKQSEDKMASDKAAEKAAQEKAAQEKAEQETKAQEQAAQEKADADKAAQDKAAQEQQAQVQTRTVSATPAQTQTAPVVAQSTQAPSQPAVNGQGNAAVVDFAKQLATKNIPYVFGGESLSGMDCSGLTHYVYKNVMGRDIGRTASAQSNNVNVKSVSAAQPGDLLFWGGRGSAYHVGIYIGNNQFIDAPVPGRTVAVETIYGGWMPSFAGSLK